MKKLLLLMVGLSVSLPVAARSVTSSQTTSSVHEGLSVGLMDPSGSVYQPGESVRFSVSSTTDAYAIVFDIDTDGYVQLLYPRDDRSIQRLAANRTYYIPEELDREFIVTGQTGIEFVFAVSIKDRGAVNVNEIAEMLQDEARPLSQRQRVDGDPFLAANRIASRLVNGIAYTRDESLAYAYFYVNEAVDYPRYLCKECQDTGKDPYEGSRDWVATTAFDQAEGLSYPLMAAFVRSGENIASGESEQVPVTVYNTYNYNEYPYYPGYYAPYWGSAFYFSVGWNWGWRAGWGWPHPYWYYPYYGVAHCSWYPYRYRTHHHYYPHYYGGGRYAYRPGLRPRGGRTGIGVTRYTSKTDLASRIRVKSVRYQRTDKLRSGKTTSLARSGRTKSRPVYRVNSRPATRTVSGVRGYRYHSRAKSLQIKGSKPRNYQRSGRQVRTIKGQPTTRRTITPRGTGRYSGKSTRYGTVNRTRFGGKAVRGGRGARIVKPGARSSGLRSAKPSVRRGSSRFSGVSRSSGHSVRRGSATRGGARSVSRGRRGK